MRPQAERVLKYLQRWGSDTDSNMGRVLDMPAPSIRRSIQELVDEGHNITFLGRSGAYTYLPFTQTGIVDPGAS